MSRNRVLAVAVFSVSAGSALSSGLHANPLFRLDIDSDNLIEQQNSNAGYSGTEAASGTPTDPAFESWKIDGGLGTVEDPDFGDPRFNSPVYNGTVATPSAFRITLKGSPDAEKIDSIRRFGMPGETASYYFNDLYRDFAQVTHADLSVIPTISATIENNAAAGGTNLAPNTAYNVTFFVYDKFFDPGGNNVNEPNVNPPTMHFTDRTPGGLGSTSDSMIFNRLAGFATSAPTALDNYTWSTTMTVFTDANAKMNVEEIAQTFGPAFPGATIGLVAATLNGIQIDAVNESTGGTVNYGDSSAWTGGVVPTGASAVANFFNNSGGTVSLGTARTVGAINFSGTGSYNLSGGSLTLESFKGPRAGVSLAVRSGSHTIDSNVAIKNRLFVNVNAGASLALTGTIDTSGGNAYGSSVSRIDKTGNGTFAMTGVTVPTITISAGTLRTTSGATKVTSLSFGRDAGGAPVSKLDLTGGAWAWDYTGESQLGNVAALVTSGRNGGTWDGNGIKSSLAASNAKYGVGYAEASALGVVGTGPMPGYPSVSIDDTTIVFRVTLRGDNDLNGNVNFDDLLKLAQNYGGTGKSWIEGDNTYDGNINFDDLLGLAQNYGGAAPALNGLSSSAFQSDWTLALSMVPEPASAGVLVLGSTALLRRRRGC